MAMLKFFQIVLILLAVYLQAREMDDTMKRCGKFADKSLEKDSGFYEGFESVFGKTSGQDINELVFNFKQVFNHFYCNGLAVEDCAVKAFNISTDFEFILQVERILFNITLKEPQHGEMTFPAFAEKCGKLYTKHRRKDHYIGFNAILESAVYDLLNSDFRDLPEDRRDYVEEWCKLHFKSPLDLFPEVYTLYHHHHRNHVKAMFKSTFHRSKRRDALLCSVAIAYDALRACALSPVWRTLKGQCREVLHELKEESKPKRLIIRQYSDGNEPFYMSGTGRSGNEECFNPFEFPFHVLVMFNTVMIVLSVGMLGMLLHLQCC